MEKILRKYIVEFLEQRDLFNPSQHGFRTGCSSLSQLLEYHDKVLRLLEEGNSVDTIYLDFSKAFDKVDHVLLFRKLRLMGISGKLGRWLHSFLTNRKKAVMVNGVSSEIAEVKSGVPQGTVLGPILFLIFIADIDVEIRYSILSSFADDTRIFKSVNSVVDSFKLQYDLNMAYKWTKKNNMTLNDAKFQLLSHGRKEDLLEKCYLSPTAKKIDKKVSVKDLGVLMDSDCKFSSHINRVADKMKEMSGWILRTFRSRSPALMLILWKSLVLPHHDYCSQLWSPYTVADIQKLEMLQRSFVRKIDGMHALNYWEQLNKLGLYSLERRRERYRIFYVWKVIEGFSPALKGISTYNHIRFGRLCHVPVIRQGPFHGLRNSSFSVKALQLFNSIPRNIRDLSGCSKDQFKNKLDEFLRKIPDEPQISGYVTCRHADTNSIVDMSKVK